MLYDDGCSGSQCMHHLCSDDEVSITVFVEGEQYETSWYCVSCLSVLVWRRLKLSNAVILAELYQRCTALNGKQRPRSVLYYNMALIKARSVCLWLVLSHSQLLLRGTTTNVEPWMHLCIRLPLTSAWQTSRRVVIIAKDLCGVSIILWSVYSSLA